MISDENSGVLFDQLIEIHSSPIHGLGVFAKTFIPKGTIWSQARPEVVLCIDRAQYENLLNSARSPKLRAFVDALNTYSFYNKSRDALVLLLDNSQYCNHSKQPNSAAWSQDGISSIALCDIQAG